MDLEDRKLEFTTKELMEFNSERNRGFNSAAEYLRSKMNDVEGNLDISGYGVYEFRNLPGAAITVLFNY